MVAPPCAVVIFGAAGDATLFQRGQHGSGLAGDAADPRCLRQQSTAGFPELRRRQQWPGGGRGAAGARWPRLD
jgi:hypothetical protein